MNCFRNKFAYVYDYQAAVPQEVSVQTSATFFQPDFSQIFKFTVSGVMSNVLAISMAEVGQEESVV